MASRNRLSSGKAARTLGSGLIGGIQSTGDTCIRELGHNGQHLASGYAPVDGDWLAYDPHGHYTGSARASRYVTWRIGNTVYDFDQFFERFYQPDTIGRDLQEKKVDQAQQ